MSENVDSSPTTEQNKNILAVVAYLGGFVTGIILLLIEKNNAFVRFHAMQSTIFSIGYILLSWAVAFIPRMGGLFSSLVSLGGLIVMIMLLWKAFNGEKYKLPYIGEVAEAQLAKMS